MSGRNKCKLSKYFIFICGFIVIINRQTFVLDYAKRYKA